MLVFVGLEGLYVGVVNQVRFDQGVQRRSIERNRTNIEEILQSFTLLEASDVENELVHPEVGLHRLVLALDAHCRVEAVGWNFDVFEGDAEEDPVLSKEDLFFIGDESAPHDLFFLEKRPEILTVSDDLSLVVVGLSVGLHAVGHFLVAYYFVPFLVLIAEANHDIPASEKMRNCIFNLPFVHNHGFYFDFKIEN